MIPFFGFSQFNLEIRAVNLEDNSSIEYVHYQLDGKSFYGTSYGMAQFYSWDVSTLENNLKITHPNFRFEERPLYQHEYEVRGKYLYLTVYGHPWKKEHIDIKVPIAKSKKVKNDTIRIEHSNYDINASLAFLPLNKVSEKPAMHRIPFKWAYDNLGDGNFVLTNQNQQVEIPFQKENWTQVACLNPVETEFHVRELHLIRKYFEERQNNLESRREMERTHEKEKDKLQHEIDELNREIDRLNGKPLAYREDYPEPELVEEPEEELIFSFKNTAAAPLNGYEVFKAEINKLLSKLQVKYSGNVTVEMSIEKDGRVRVKSRHAGSDDKQEVLTLLNDHLVNQRWEPAEHQGRKFASKVILSLEITPAR